jgi:hypothetical protein
LSDISEARPSSDHDPLRGQAQEDERLGSLAKLLEQLELTPEATKIILAVAFHDIKYAQRASREENHYVIATSDHKFVQVPMLKLPSAPPALWKDKAARGKLNPMEFVQHYYKDWLGSGLARSHLSKLDGPLYSAYTMWERRQPPEVERLPAKPSAIYTEARVRSG